MNKTKMTRTAMVGFATALLLCGSPLLLPNKAPISIVQPAKAASLRIGIFYDSLAPYGAWVDHRHYGYVFVPYVRSGWRPYVYGHWVYTDRYGWYWVSDEPFSWAVYHYGRWDYDPAFGWLWIPGNVWAPAWVTWRYGGDYIGWAPIGPAGNGYIYGRPKYYDPPMIEAWVFVPAHRFVARDVERYVLPIFEINVALHKARDRHHIHYRGDTVFNPFLPRSRARQIVKQQIDIYNVNSVDTPSKATNFRSRNQLEIRAFSPEITAGKPEKKPRKIVKRPSELKSRALLEELDRGKKSQGSAPSPTEFKTGPRRDQTEQDRKARTKGERMPNARTKEKRQAPPFQVQPREPGKSKKAREHKKPKYQTQQPRRGQPEARNLDGLDVPKDLPSMRQRGHPKHRGQQKESQGPPSRHDAPRGFPKNHRGKPQNKFH